MIKIFNGRIITPYRIIPNGTVLIKDGIIVEVVAGDIEIEGATAIDAKGKFIAPGFIDLHVHGGGGHDFMDGVEDGFLEIAKIHAKYGTTAMLPTTLSSGKEDLLKTIEVYKVADE